MRLDKWLWASRFYKSRSLAIKAIESKKIVVNDIVVKPSKLLKIKDKIRITKNSLVWHITVIELSNKRKSPNIAKELYTESYESMSNRKRALEILKIDRLSTPRHQERPTKKNRRIFEKLNNKNILK